MDDKDLITDGCESIVIDLDGVGAAQSIDSYNYSSGSDTITITGLNLNSADTISFPSYTSSGTYSLGASNGYNTTWSNNYSITGVNPPTVKIESNGITMDAGTDIKIGDQSLKEFMTKMEQRLSILVPNPEKLEKFEALKKAYEHYKTLESLCFDEPKEDQE